MGVRGAHAWSLADDERVRIMQKVAAALRVHQEIMFAYVHGSFVEGPFHDMDVAVYLAPAAVVQDRLRGYESDLASELERQVRMPVDVRLLNDAPLSFRYHVLKGRPLMVKDPDVLDEFRARTWDDYLDFAPFARRYLQEVLSE